MVNSYTYSSVQFTFFLENFWDQIQAVHKWENSSPYLMYKLSMFQSSDLRFRNVNVAVIHIFVDFCRSFTAAALGCDIVGWDELFRLAFRLLPKLLELRVRHTVQCFLDFFVQLSPNLIGLLYAMNSKKHCWKIMFFSSAILKNIFNFRAIMIYQNSSTNALCLVS